jgi:uncharacterized membrane protein YfcA
MLAVLVVIIAAALAADHIGTITSPQLPRLQRLGVAAGAAIGVVAAMMGVAGRELLIPTIVLLYGLDACIAGSLSPAVSLPTMLVAFARYSVDRSFVMLARRSASSPR